ncbi:class C beta-lactamase [Neorhizobium galegae]|uniref:Beta-lactamase n=1 Tax=Neorhizobium galegae bv. officinalis TaxID=323656 RepID=A0A0T7GFM3_NEOGA|nr:class C beta-lactamase [Neorhizobium galegae]CDZ45977.1 AmpC beta-lactamase CMY-80 [Neorhizobium galegae bv. officinalis]
MRFSGSANRTVAAGHAIALALVAAFNPGGARADETERRIATAVDKAMKPLMSENDIPGMAVGVTINGRSFVWNYGLADREKAVPVGDDTLFEIGSISKTFTATLGAYAQAEGKLSFFDKGSDHMSALRGSALDRVNLLDLGTYTAGGLPLQFPDEVADNRDITRFYRGWRPSYEPGTHRVYSNPSIGLFGYLAAESLGKPFLSLMEGKLLPALGLRKTYLNVPAAEIQSYAFGYNKAGKPIRVTPGALDAQAYGIKTTAADLLRFLEVNIDPSRLEPSLQKAMESMQIGYFRVGDMYQSLGWELYAWPTTLDTVLEGNSSDMALKPQPAVRLNPPEKPGDEILLNKTGSTGGFGAYAAFVPERRIGVVLLANRNFPIPARIKAAFTILKAVETIQEH